MRHVYKAGASETTLLFSHIVVIEIYTVSQKAPLYHLPYLVKHGPIVINFLVKY